MPLGEYAVKLDTESLKDLDITGLLSFQRAANYLAAAQIFLQSDTLLQRALTQDDIKPRLLGHWGTCAGLTLVYAHASYLITRHSQRSEDVQMLFVTGPGHGAPSILSTLFIEVCCYDLCYQHHLLTRRYIGDDLEILLSIFSG